MQPSEETLNKTLGAPVSGIQRAPEAPKVSKSAARPPPPEWGSIQDRILRATEEANNKFYSSTSLAAKYANVNALRDFVGSVTAETGDSSESVVQSRSRIDDMIVASNNASALMRSTGKKSTKLTDVLNDKKNIVTIDDFVKRVLGLGSLDSVGQKLLAAPYQVSGLSQTEPNPEWTQMQRDREALEARRLALVREAEVFQEGRDFVGATSLVADQRRAEELRLQIMEYAPIDSVELLKPAAEVRALNERWRTLLGEALVRIYRQYEQATAESVATTHGDAVDAGDAAGVVNIYMERVIAPVFDEYLAQLRSATYEDMPLTLEVLHSYFTRFMSYVLESLLHARTVRAQEDLRAMQEQAVRDAPLNIAGELEQQANEMRAAVDERYRGREEHSDDDDGPLFENGLDTLGSNDPLTTDEQERRVEQAYLRQALHIYATPIYEDWFESWLTAVRAGVGGSDLDDNTIQTMRRAVRAMVAGRLRAHEERNARRGRSLPMYNPIPEKEIVINYARLVNNDIALSRIDALIEQDDEHKLELAIEVQLRSPADADSIQLPVELLLYPRADRYEILGSVVAAERTRIESTYKARGSVNDDDDEDQIDAALRATRDDALNDLTAREATLRDQITYYSPLQPADVRAHAPRDEPSDGYTPFDVSYPLDVTAARRQQPDLEGIVRRLGAEYDAEEIHKRADELRAVLSYGYADQLVQREIMRIDHALRHIIKPDRDVPLDLSRPLTSGRPLELTATIKLRDELAIAAEAPRESLLDSGVADALQTLMNAQWRATWHFKPRYGLDEGRDTIIETQLLPPRRLTAKLVRPALPDQATALGGLYWVEFERVGDPAGVKYRSVFTGSVRIVAQCKRTGKTFEVGSETHGEATWREAPRDELTRNMSEEWLVLVTRGDEALKELLQQRAVNADFRIEPNVPNADLFLPPWGGEDDQSLLRAFAALQRSSFSVNAIFGRVVERIGGQLAAELRALATATISREDWARQAGPLSRLSPMRLFALLADVDVLEPGTTRYSDLQRAIQIHASLMTNRGTWSDTTLGEGAVRLIGRFEYELGEPVLLQGNTPADIALRIRRLLENAPRIADIREQYLFAEQPDLFDESALPLSAVNRLRSDYQRSLEEMPLATLLAALYTPVIWKNLTWREKRFARTMLTRFENFARDYRRVERRTLYYNQIMADQPWSQHAPRTLSYDNNRAMILDPMRPGDAAPTPAIPALEAEIDRRLARMTAQSIVAQLGRPQYTVGDRYTDVGFRSTSTYVNGIDSITNIEQRHVSETFLYDLDTWREFTELVERRLVRTGLLDRQNRITTDSVDADTLWTEPGVRSYYRHTVLRPPCVDNAREGTVLSNRSGRTVWLGSYSYRTNQPDAYSVVIDETRGAYVEQRGSAPVNKGYDFQGIHDLIVLSTKQYTNVIRGVGVDSLTDAAIVRLREKLAQRIRDLVLAHNYLAFVAHPLGGHRILMADELLLLLDDRQQFFQRIGTAAIRLRSATLL